MKYTSIIAVVLIIHFSISITLHAQIIVIGGGASGTTAALQAARMGLNVEIIEETPWLGGMLTAAGVSAIDGNHSLPSGIWGEFRERLYQQYGGPAGVNTGWVSHTLFEPSVGAQIWKEMVSAEKNIVVHFNSQWTDIRFENNQWMVQFLKDKKPLTIKGTILIDATELGDAAAKLGYPYYLGMDAQARFNEAQAPPASNTIIQDLTYVAILKDYGMGKDKTIPKPKDYKPEIFRCACSHADPISNEKPKMDCDKMLSYGRLPGNKYMINWPNCGNDIYLNIVEMTGRERALALEKAKQTTLQFVYFIQTELGYKNLGLTDDFPTADRLPMIPYHRESRRFESETMLTLPFVAEPYLQQKPIYKTGIAVGDYPIDHHHKKNPDAPTIDFIKIRVPSYNVPLGSLIPKGSTQLIVAEKSIGVSNIVNGATRLQPVVMGIGQAAGALAAISVNEQKNLQEINIRTVQQSLIRAGAFIMPYIDVEKTALYFESVQRIGATGILKGIGVPYKWANQTWFYPEREISEFELVSGMRENYPELLQNWSASGSPVNIKFMTELIKLVKPTVNSNLIEKRFAELLKEDKKIMNRWQVAVLIDEFLNPFSERIDLDGRLIK